MARLRRLKELTAATPGSFWTCQYDNPEARNAYLPIASELCERVRAIDALVSPVGTGASACGLIEGIRAQAASVALVAVDTHGSVLFGQPDAPRTLRGLGNSLVPANLKHELVDECHWVTTGEASLATCELYRDFGIDAGPSSGAAFLVALWIHRTHPTWTVVFVCADTGERYRDTVLDQQWLRQKGLWCDCLPERPLPVDDPRRSPNAWSRFEWRRRRLVEVLSAAT